MPWQSNNRLFFNESSIETNAPAESGVYGCWNENNWIFIGDSNDLQKALLEHERIGFGPHIPDAFTYELWPAEVRRAKAWNLIVEFQPVLNSEHKHSTEELFHFVGFRDPNNREKNYKILGDILRERQLKRKWPGDPRAVSLQFDPRESLKSGELMVSNVICFCDIRREDLEIHTSKYGEFGLSFFRGHLIRFGARPVMYIPCDFEDYLSHYGRTLINDILAVYESSNEVVLKELPEREHSRALGHRIQDRNDAMEAMAGVYEKDFMAFVKAYDTTLSERALQNFFMEREWRRFGALDFEPQQVVSVVVAPGYLAQAKNDFPEYEDRIYELPSGSP